MNLGKANWVYDQEYDFHMPTCSQPKKYVINGKETIWSCGNGPLTGDQIRTGDCGEHEDCLS